MASSRLGPPPLSRSYPAVIQANLKKTNQGIDGKNKRGKYQAEQNKNSCIGG
jgi:hypothetical protein